MGRRSGPRDRNLGQPALPRRWPERSPDVSVQDTPPIDVREVLLDGAPLTLINEQAVVTFADAGLHEPIVRATDMEGNFSVDTALIGVSDGVD